MRLQSRKWVVAALLMMVPVLSGGGARAADPWAIGAGIVGGGIILGPQGSTEDFVYFYSYDDENSNGRRDEGEPIRDQLRLDIKSHCWWSKTRYAHGLVRVDALQGFLSEFGKTGESEFKGNESAASVLGGDSRLNIEEYVPVIVMSNNPNSVLKALIRTAEEYDRDTELFGYMALQSELSKINASMDVYTQTLNSKQGDAALLVSSYEKRKVSLTQIQKSLTTVKDTAGTKVLLKPAADSKLEKALAEGKKAIDDHAAFKERTTKVIAAADRLKAAAGKYKTASDALKGADTLENKTAEESAKKELNDAITAFGVVVLQEPPLASAAEVAKLTPDVLAENNDVGRELVIKNIDDTAKKLIDEVKAKQKTVKNVYAGLIELSKEVAAK